MKDKITFKKEDETPKSSVVHGLMAEQLFISVFGKKSGYDGMASVFNNDKYFIKESLKLIDRFLTDTSQLQASEQFIDYLSYQLGYLKKEFASVKTVTNEMKGLIIIILKVISTLYGYHYSAGSKLLEPYFIPSMWSEMQGWNNFSEYYKTKEYLLKQKRLEIINRLVKEGKTSSEISLIMNITGYKVAQFRQAIKAQEKNGKSSKK